MNQIGERTSMLQSCCTYEVNKKWRKIAAAATTIIHIDNDDDDDDASSKPVSPTQYKCKENIININAFCTCMCYINQSNGARNNSTINTYSLRYYHTFIYLLECIEKKEKIKYWYLELNLVLPFNFNIKLGINLWQKLFSSRMTFRLKSMNKTLCQLRFIWIRKKIQKYFIHFDSNQVTLPTLPIWTN